MKASKLLSTLAFAGLMSGSVQAAPWLGDFVTSNGATVHDGVIFSIGGFDVYSEGSAAFFLGATQLSPTGTTLAVGDIVTTVYQGVVNAFNTENSPNLLWPGQTTGTYQLTVAAIFQEVVSIVSPGLAILDVLDGGQVGLFYDDASLSGTFIVDAADILAGVGYTDGMLLASGSMSSTSLPTLFTTDGTNASGSANIVGPLNFAALGDPTVGAAQPGFIPVPGGYTSITTLQYGSNQGTDFRTVNFFDTANGFTALAANADFVVRADGNINLTEVPEPASLALLGLGLLGLGLTRRRMAKG